VRLLARLGRRIVRGAGPSAPGKPSR